MWRHEKRDELLIVAGVLLAAVLIPGRVPPGIVLLGLVAGAGVALNAAGMILVYRSNRIINFAQVAPGAAAAMVFVSLVRFRPFLHWIDFACGEERCWENPTLIQVNYWLSLLLALGLSVAFSWLIYTTVIRRFAQAPRLLLTVATVLVVPVLARLALMAATGFLVDSRYKTGQLPAPPLEVTRFPSDFTFSVNPTIFHASDVLTIEIALFAVVGIMLYLQYSATGTAIRASSSDPDRAAMLGIDVHAVTTRVWLLAGFLSGVAALLAATAFSGTVSPDLTVPMLVRVLAVAVIARMVSLPMAGLAGLALGIFEQAAIFSQDSTTLFDGSLFIVIGASLLLQHRRLSRAGQQVAGRWRAAREVRPIPIELRGTPEVRRGLVFGGVGAFLLLAGLPWVLSPGDNTLAAAYLIYLAIGMSILVLTGWAGQISLGQLGIAAVGAYAAAATGLPFIVAIAVAGLAGALAALAIGAPALRLRGLHLAIMTLAFALAVNAVLLGERYLGTHLPTSVARPEILGMDFNDERAFYYFCLAFVAVVTVAVLGLRRSRTARVLLAARDNELAAQAYGISLMRARLGAFVASGFIAGSAGAMYAYHQKAVGAGSFDPSLGIDLFLIMVIGGLGSIAGPVIGILIYALPIFLNLPELVRLVVQGPGLLVLLLVLPNGVGHVVFDMRDNFLRRVAAKHRILVPSLIADKKRADFERERAPIAPRVRAGGVPVFVPTRYGLAQQWAADSEPVAAGPEVRHA